MYVYRMMSLQEYQDLCAGKTLVNTKVHAAEHKFSESTGFCFLPWEVTCTWYRQLANRMYVENSYKLSALQAVYSLLPDKRQYDVWVQLKVVNPQLLQQSRGRYLDTNTDKIVWAREYCTTAYSAKDLQPMHAFSMQKVLDILFDRFIAGRAKDAD